MSRLLVYGCGDLAWARRPDVAFGPHWETGRLSHQLDLRSPREGGAPITVGLTDELDWQAGWMPSRESPRPQVEIHRGGAPVVPVLPPWRELADVQVKWITGQLEGSGVLVTPRAWRESRPGRAFLRAWARAGWTWAPLEEVLQRKFTAGPRLVTAGPSWLRVTEPSGAAVIPNCAEAALAVELVEPILASALEAAGESEAAEWRRHEQPGSGWFTRVQIIHRATAALHEGRGSVELGSPEAPLFMFSSAEAQERFRALAELRLTVDLPSLSAAIWWQQVAEPELLRPPEGASRRPSFRWNDLETILIEHQGGAAERPTRDLERYLKFNGLPRRVADPAELVEASEVASDLGGRLERWDAEDREAEQRTAADAETPPREAPPPRETPPPREASPPREAPPPRRTPVPRETPPAEAAEPSAAPPLDPEDLGTEAAAGNVPAVRAADPLHDFRPELVAVDEPHRTEYLKIWVDGVPIDQENIHPAELGDGRIGYSIEGASSSRRLARGAVVRVDFEPAEPE